MPKKKPDPPIKFFPTPDALRTWLAAHHNASPGLWLRFYKKSSGKLSLTYDQALDQALCYGWIDGQSKSENERAYLQRFTPRRPKSPWSRRNTQHIARLIEAGLMTPSGLAAVEAAKADGRWSAAYDSPKNSAAPADFLKLLAQDKKARAFFHTLNKANTYAITYRLQTAKTPE